MRCRLVVLVSLAATLLLSPSARAHLGSPDVFSEGKVGPYQARITIRMPPVVPGRAEIDVQALGTEPLSVSYLPLYAKTAIKNAPPPERATAVAESPGLYRGELWLMSVGAYSIEVRLAGAAGEGTIQIPVNSVATHQLPLPPLLGTILAVLGVSLAIGTVAITRAAVSQSVHAPGVPLSPADRRKGIVAGAITAVVITLLVVGGWRWWKSEEREFQRRLRAGAWPDLAAQVTVDGPQRILNLVVGAKDFATDYALPLLADHGKLLHLFLIREGSRDVFAHLHPIRTGGKSFALALPPVPSGDYRIFCDLSFSNSALSSTAATFVHIPEIPSAAEIAAKPVESDPDDSWAAGIPSLRSASGSEGNTCALPGGLFVTWKPHPPLRTKASAFLDFEIRDAAGAAIPLQPYMGMMSHAAVLREDGGVFAHLHPAGNFSMASQAFFQEKLLRETEGPGTLPNVPMDHSKMGHVMPASATDSSISLPYEFPSPGRYRIWVQFKTAGEVKTAVFDAEVSAPLPPT
jgi:hypothetical protein